MFTLGHLLVPPGCDGAFGVAAVGASVHTDLTPTKGDPFAPQGNFHHSQQCGLRSHTLLPPPHPEKKCRAEAFSQSHFLFASHVWQGQRLP